jgi:HAE1 family hydrophobic/amphiphilic exporter-1
MQGPDLARTRTPDQTGDGENHARFPGLVDLDSSVKPNKPTLDVVVKRDAASDLGLGVGQIGSALRTLVAGQTVGNWRAPTTKLTT